MAVRPRHESVAQSLSERSRKHGWAPGAAVGAFAVYFLTLAPTVTGEDSGELITAAWCLGIPHPPGYPVWTLLAHLFTLLPFGGVAWRVNLSSAFWGAATVYVLVLTARRLGCRGMAALAGGLALAYSREFWEQSVIAEVYTLNASCVVLGLYLVLRWHASRHAGSLYALALLAGLGLGVHNTMMITAPIFALFVLVADRPRRWGHYGLLVAVAVAAWLLTCLYLPWRSLADPVMDWGNPETFANTMGVVLRRQYAFMLSENPRSWSRFAMQMAAFGNLWWREFTPWVGMAGAFGLALLVRRHPWRGLLLLTTGIAVVVAFTLAQNFDQTREWLWVMSVFAIPAYAVTALGLACLIEAVAARPRWQRMTTALAIVCVVSPLVAHWRHNDRSDSYTAEDLARNTLGPLAKDAIYIPQSDPGAFAALYMQAVEGFRPDVLLGRTTGYLSPMLLADAPEDLRAAVGPFPRGRDEGQVFAWLLAASNRPLYFERRPKLPADAPGVRWRRVGLLWRALRPGEESDAWQWEDYTWRSLEEDAARDDYTARALLLALHLARAEEALRADDEAKAAGEVARALFWYGRDVRSLNNVGALYARAGEAATARSYFEEALQRDPGNTTATRNLTRLDAPDQ